MLTKELKAEDAEFGKKLKIKLVGQVDRSVTEHLDAMGLRDNTEIIPYIPHGEVLPIQQSSQVLLLLINNTPNAKGILTGKLYEYLASGRPILAIGPEDGDAAMILNETHAGTTISFGNKEKMKETLQSLYQRYLNNELPDNTHPEVERYSRRVLAGQFADLLGQISI